MGYLEAQQGADARTAFRTAEKQYKRYKNGSTRHLKHRGKVPAVDLSQVLDFKKIAESLSGGVASLHGVSRLQGEELDRPVYSVQGRPGFFFIPEALDVRQQAYWIEECVARFPQPPNRTNYNAVYGPLEDLWTAAEEDCVLAEEGNQGVGDGESWRFVPRDQIGNSGVDPVTFITAKTMLRKLRWATVGLQFDWSRKAYDGTLPHTPIPSRLAALAASLARPAGGFRAEAAIINYYGPDDMLGGHVDDMEADLSKAIVSISLGCKAIFLLGGETRDEAPIAMFLRSGDAVLMAGPTRRCFHGIPRTFVEPEESDLPDFHMSDSLLQYIKYTRINMNIRQVYYCCAITPAIHSHPLPCNETKAHHPTKRKH